MISNLKKSFLVFVSALCFLTLGLLCFSNQNNLKVFADKISNASYFVASVNNNNFIDGDTVFLNAGQTLNISFGKPTGNPYAENIYTAEEEIGEFALSDIESRFSLTINGQPIDTERYKLLNLFQIKTFIYSPDYASNPDTTNFSEFKYFEMNIDLKNTTYFPTGEYVFNFFNYLEYTNADYAISTTQTFTTTLYIFNTTDYFLSDNAENANVSFENTRLVSKNDTTYKNYHFFNYTNYNNGNTQGNFLPKIKFDPFKFELDINKTYQGITQSVRVTYFANDFIILGNGTSENFIDVAFNEETNLMELIFYDIGDYTIKYNFIYSKDGVNTVSLNNPSIENFKQDILYIFGYQLFYFDINSQQKEEFKQLELSSSGFDNSGFAGGITSADVSYLIPYELLWSQTIDDIQNDSTLLDTLKNMQPATTNQPAVSVLYNASLVTSNMENGELVSYFYKLDESTNDWLKDDQNQIVKFPYQNESFADSGTYLLKVVYNFSNNYNSSGNRATGEYFTQYFYFNINNTKADVMIKEIVENEDGTQIEQTISTNTFTQNSVKVYLGAQSVFNSDVRLVIEGKQHNILNYSIIHTIDGSDEEQSFTVSENYNYRVILYFGLNKTQTSYFTIDNTAFEKVEILTVKQSEASSQYFVKGQAVDFFTSSSVTVQWKEKASGASSKAFYKFIPFKNTGYSTPLASQFQFDKAIPTNYSLEYNINQTLAQARYYNSANLTLLTQNYVFSEQGFYIIYLTDSAGNWQYITFCIDKTEINIWQLSTSSSTYQTIQKYNVVSADTTLQWGLYKLIKLNINTSKISEIADSWVKDVISQKYYDVNDNDIFLSTYDSGELYFAPEISSVAYVQEGTTYNKINNQTTYDIKMIKNVNGVVIVNEITYVLYLIDESNLYFNTANSLNQSDFANFASKNYSITMTSDAARADVVFNNSNSSSNDYTNLNYTSANLLQAGFTDSYSYNENFETYNSTLDTRSKYFYSTGTTLNGNVNLLTYLFVASPSSLINVSKVVVYYYPFIIQDNVYKLSDNAIETVIFDLESGKDLTVLIENGDFAGYQAFNLNPQYLSGSGYQTADGKYVIVRSYTEESNANVDEYDFMHRENIFIVDRQNIVSSPLNDGSNKSVIGGNIHVNVLDGYVGEISFENLYMAYYTDSELFQSNKLPLVNYVPIAKYGYIQNNIFKNFDVLKYFYTTTSDSEHYYLNRYSIDNNMVKSILGVSYFGEGTYTTEDFGFNQNLSYITNTSFDLSVNIDFSQELNGIRSNVYNSSLTNLDGFYVSNLFRDSGYYFVTVTQNYANGNSFPNLRNSLTYIFRIVTQAPDFNFIDSQNNTLESVDGLINGNSYKISYTNDNSTITISWTDPSDKYMAKIDTSGNNGRSAGIKWWTNVNPTPQSINVGSGNEGDTGDIVVDGLKKSFTLDISKLTSGTILYVYMQYEGDVANNPNAQITKALYIDKEAPTTVLNQLIQTTSINGVSVAGLSRLYLDENNNITNSLKQYNAPTTTGSLAYYSFAVELSNENLVKYFNKQNAVNGFYTEGYYYYAKEQTSGESLVVSTIASAKNAFATHTLQISTEHLQAGKYYEIIEQDLAGNLTIYLIYFTKPMEQDDVVLYYNKPETDMNKLNSIRYGNLSLNPYEVYAKGSFEATEINLYNYPWQILSVNGTTYMSSPELENNTFYNISNWSDISTSPQTVSIDEILSFTASRSVQNLILVDSSKNLHYPININVTDEVLQFSATTDFEGLKIYGVNYTNGINVVLKSIQIYSWESSRYISIYDQTDNFTSNSFVEFTSSLSNNISYSFHILEPKVAYKYIFTDNFGVNYVFYHTCGEPIIEDKIVGDVATISVLEDDGVSNLWNVGISDLTYYYSNVDYYVYINVMFLTYDPATDTFLWQKFDSGTSTTQYGNLVSNGIVNGYYECHTSRISNSINYITLKAQENILGLNNFAGNAVKYEITLVNVNENPSVALDIKNVHQDRILINNINPSIMLFDKNNEDKTNDLFNGNTIFSGQLTIRFGQLDYDNNFMFESKITMQYENSEETDIESGTVINIAGNYIIRTYLNIGGEFVLLKTQGFIINESSNEFFNVTVYNPETGTWEIKESTGKVFEYNGNFYSNHYLVNTEQYKISTNEEQDIEAFELDFTYNNSGTVTKFYQISNYHSSSTSINYYQKTIAITYVHTENLITANSFYYTSADGRQEQLSGISSQVIVTTDNQDFDSLTIVYNSFFGIKANQIDVHVYYGESGLEYNPIKNIVNNNTNSITLTESGTYVISFSDLAGNTHTFIDNVYGYNSKTYTLTYINGVAFNINNSNPIENGVYNDSVTISLPKSLDSLYDVGGKPSINVIRNGSDYTANVKKDATTGEFIIDQSGYYTVSFSAVINGFNVRQQEYSFTIISSTEGRWTFEYSPFANYEITSIVKDGKVLDLSPYFDFNSYVIEDDNNNKIIVRYLTNVLISVYDEITGAGDYEITIRTNVGIAGQEFKFNFVIKDTNEVPIKISVEEGTKTTDPISISFNAYTLYSNLGECEVKFDNNHRIKINQEYLNSLNDYNVNMQIENAGTYFVQVLTESGKVLYSYKVIKQDPLNTFSIIIIVVSVVFVVGLTVVIILLRKKMKIK